MVARRKAPLIQTCSRTQNRRTLLDSDPAARHSCRRSRNSRRSTRLQSHLSRPSRATLITTSALFSISCRVVAKKAAVTSNQQNLDSVIPTGAPQLFSCVRPFLKEGARRGAEWRDLSSISNTPRDPNHRLRTPLNILPRRRPTRNANPHCRLPVPHRPTAPARSLFLHAPNHFPRLLIAPERHQRLIDHHVVQYFISSGAQFFRKESRQFARPLN